MVVLTLTTEVEGVCDAVSETNLSLKGYLTVGRCAGAAAGKKERTDLTSMPKLNTDLGTPHFT